MSGITRLPSFPEILELLLLYGWKLSPLGGSLDFFVKVNVLALGCADELHVVELGNTFERIFFTFKINNG